MQSTVYSIATLCTEASLTPQPPPITLEAFPIPSLHMKSKKQENVHHVWKKNMQIHIELLLWLSTDINFTYSTCLSFCKSPR